MRWQIDNEPGMLSNVIDANAFDRIHSKHLFQEITYLKKKTNVRNAEPTSIMPCSL